MLLIFQMTVRVSDSGRPTRFSDIPVQVVISRIQPPTFQQTTLRITVLESRPINYTVFDARATLNSPIVSYLDFFL
jgi:hypothetical protein